MFQDVFGNVDVSPNLISIRNVTYDNEGWYTCYAGNNIGDTYQSAYLTVVERESFR